MRFTINLATRAYPDYQRITRVLVVSLLILISLSTWKALSFFSNLGKLERLRDDIISLEGRLNSRQAGFSEQDYSRQQKTILFYNEIIERKTANWLALLERLENATPEGIALASLGLDKKNGQLKLDGRARNFSHVRSYMGHLENSKNFTDILLLSHADITVGEKGHGVQFTITCRAVEE